MSLKLEINAIHTDVSDDLKKYITKKIGRLDRFLSRRARESSRGEVKLKQSKNKGKKQHTCEVVLHLPHETITVSETTINMFAAVDIVETKLKNQLKKYKETHSVLRGRTRQLLSKIRSR